LQALQRPKVWKGFGKCRTFAQKRKEMKKSITFMAEDTFSLLFWDEEGVGCGKSHFGSISEIFEESIKEIGLWQH